MLRALDPAPPIDHDQSEDLHLLGRAAAGDRDAFARLFDRHGSVALGLLTRMLGERSSAEEVLQETFLQVWQQARRYEPRLARPRAWILMIARSRALDRLRSQSARERREEVVARWETASSGPVGIRNLEQEERRRAVAAALDALPAEQRQAIELAFFGGLTHTQIAERLAVPLGTVKSRILLGMNKLRQSLASYS
ncbi:MAG TPA: sigma-70 family RNA polymerase sigma factor [Thermoanaerobaculia bacterium]|nr:sigma-70 family RNA polymerase sigma factor [Thermoanaerobaculia bacterium]